MSSTGATAWQKYFQGKGDIETSIKKVSGYFDIEGKKKLGDLGAGTRIIYKSVSKYEPKALITFVSNNKIVTCRVPFDNIAKPGVKSSGSVSLKPQAFGVGDKTVTVSDYKKIVLNSIDERKDLNGGLKTYLSKLFDYCCKGQTKLLEVRSVFNKNKDVIPINDVNKDFGEVIGPAGVYYNKLLEIKQIKLSTTTKVFIPSRPNEPLMDYSLIDKQKTYVISAKSGKTTNVVKPADVINLLKKDKKIFNKWKTTKQFKLLETLADNSILLGPIKGVASIRPDLITPANADKFTKNLKDLTAVSQLIAQNEYLSKQKNPTTNEIMYECEKIISNETKSGDVNLNKLFADAIQQSVIYVKFEIDSNGQPDWEVIGGDDFVTAKAPRIFLRSKNGYTRASDRMGIQI